MMSYLTDLLYRFPKVIEAAMVGDVDSDDGPYHQCRCEMARVPLNPVSSTVLSFLAR
jgi:hypothetical protein